jgi:outer membrane autotransporter protein
VLVVGAAPEEPIRNVISGSDLDPNELAVARNLDELCPRLIELAQGETPLTDEQAELLALCESLLQQTDRDALADTIEQLGAQEITAIRTQALVLTKTHNQSVMDRMLALRAARSGRPAPALQVTMNGMGLPLGSLLGGGASADDAEPNALLNERTGMWLRANYGDGRKTASAADNGFKSRQWGMSGGVDHRFGDAWVIGGSIGYGASDLEFRPQGEGSLDTRSWTGSVYGSYSTGQLYIDGVLNYADASYDSVRRIMYDELGAPVDRVAFGSTEGATLSGGFALGYDFTFGGLTLSPSIGYSFVDVRVKRFVERGAGGLNLAYDSQYYESSTGEASLSASYVINMRWGAFMPHVRGALVREFDKDVEVFGVRFAHDPFASSSDPTPPIVVRAEVPDTSYFRLAAGASLQLAYGISGYAEYMRLAGFRNVTFQDFTVGLRVQRGFR